jgi:2,4-dienoyl-CoA reductase-like NADH-dependent reductase (Old Yellow Enzyme family)
MRGPPVISAGKIGYGYQVPYAERLHNDADILSMAVGLIIHADQAEAILQERKADLVALAREILYNPHWPMDAAQKMGLDREFASVPPPQAYWLAKRLGSVDGIVPSTFQRGLGDEL